MKTNSIISIINENIQKMKEPKMNKTMSLVAAGISMTTGFSLMFQKLKK